MSEVWATAMTYSRKAIGSLWRSFIMFLVFLALQWLFHPSVAVMLMMICTIVMVLDMYYVHKGNLTFDGWRVLQSCGEVILFVLIVLYLFTFFGPSGLVGGAIGFILLNILLGIVLMVKNREQFWAAVNMLTAMIQEWRKR